MMINAIWLDGQTKEEVKEMQKTAFVQDSTSSDQEPDAMAAQTAQNEKNLAAFEGLKGKAEEALQRTRDEETKKQSEHDIQMMSLKQAIALAENNVDDAKKEKARLAKEKAECEEEKETVSASKAADEKSLEETTHECKETAVAWDNRQKEAA